VAMTIMRPVSVYRLYNDAELLQCIREHNAQGVLATLVPLVALNDSSLTGEADALAVRFVRAADQPMIGAPCDDRIVLSDFTSISFMTRAEYAAANPDNPLPED
jgi:hypothetical protein